MTPAKGECVAMASRILRMPGWKIPVWRSQTHRGSPESTSSLSAMILLWPYSSYRATRSGSPTLPQWCGGLRSPVSATAHALVHPASFYLGLRFSNGSAEGWWSRFVSTDQDVKVDTALVDPFGAPWMKAASITATII